MATTQPDTEFFGDDTVGPEPVPEAIPAADPVDPTEQGEDPELVELSDDARRARWQARRPPVLHLKPGIVYPPGTSDCLPLFEVGDRIVVDCCTRHLRGTPWLETIVGKVRSIDDDTGVVSVFDEESDPRNPMVRWVSFKDSVYDFRLAPARGNPFTVTAVRQAAKPAPQPGDPPKRGRGRPKGSLNRPKEVIEAEREAYRKMREEKRSRRTG